MSSSLSSEERDDDTLLWRSWIWEILQLDSNRALRTILGIADGRAPAGNSSSMVHVESSIGLMAVNAPEFLKAKRVSPPNLHSKESTMTDSPVSRTRPRVSHLVVQSRSNRPPNRPSQPSDLPLSRSSHRCSSFHLQENPFHALEPPRFRQSRNHHRAPPPNQSPPSIPPRHNQPPLSTGAFTSRVRHLDRALPAKHHLPELVRVEREALSNRRSRAIFDARRCAQGGPRGERCRLGLCRLERAQRNAWWRAQRQFHEGGFRTRRG